MRRKTKVINYVVLWFVIIILLIIHEYMDRKDMTKNLLPFIVLGIIIFFIRFSMSNIRIVNYEIIIENYFRRLIYTRKEFEITAIHSFGQGAFYINVKNQSIRLKSSKDNYTIVYQLTENNPELHELIEKKKICF